MYATITAVSALFTNATAIHQVFTKFTNLNNNQFTPED